ncbi:MAG: alginate lyase family protein [Acidobacteria bacterium]|nr:alginate lyase family protein [Acidobacteriota bacterium]
MLRLFRTLKHLRWEQVAYRPLRIAQFRLYRHFPALANPWTMPQGAPEVAAACEIIRSVFLERFTHLNSPLTGFDQRINDLGDNTFTFLNRRVRLYPLDWNSRYESHLWNYQLHYFSFALWCARSRVERRDDSFEPCRKLIESWLSEARIGRSDGWDAYPTSLRVVNWIYAYSLIENSYDNREFLDRWRGAIHAQLDFLSRHLEHHLQANHLLKNVKALFIGGLFFNREDWIEKGGSLLLRELEEQILDDGGHYERSPMYHSQTLADFLECHALQTAFGRLRTGQPFDIKLQKMAGFLDAMTYQDGSFALFNDSANTEETSPIPVIESAQKIVGYAFGNYPAAFPETGYFLWENADKSEKIIVDAGPPSVDYNTAHAHCDIASYELWLDGSPLIVDSGVHGYGGDRYREFCRSTRAHNTITIDGLEQSEIWDTFRMARRAEIVEAAAESNENCWSFRCRYHPYHGKKLTHQRSIRRGSAGEWVFEDSVTGGSTHLVESFIHLHPAINAKKIKVDSHNIECRSKNLDILIEPFGAETVEIIHGSLSPIQGWYFPDFGRAEKRSTIRITYRAESGCVFGYKIKRDSEPDGRESTKQTK